MSKNQSLVEYISEMPYSEIDASLARRLIVEGRVKVNGEVVEDPAFRLPFDDGFFVDIDRKEKPTAT